MKPTTAGRFVAWPWAGRGVRVLLRELAPHVRTRRAVAPRYTPAARHAMYGSIAQTKPLGAAMMVDEEHEAAA